MKIYISGPMTGHPGNNYAAFSEAEDQLKACYPGAEIVSPAKLPHKYGSAWEDYMRADIKALMDCDAVHLLEGWEGSRGARLEAHIAENLGMKFLDILGDSHKKEVEK